MFGKRLMSSVVLVALALVLLFAGGGVLAFALLCLSLIAYRELAKACGVAGGMQTPGRAARNAVQAAEGPQAGSAAKAGKDAYAGDAVQAGKDGHGGSARISPLEAVGYAGCVLYYLAVYAGADPVYWIGVLGLAFLGMMFVYVFSFPRIHADSVMKAFFCLFYAPVLFSFIYLTRELPGGIYMVWLIFFSSWICDTCAYLTGMALGKHKLAPVLSPKKSVEGAVGGVAGSALVGALFGFLFLEKLFADQNITWIAALICASGAVISQVGDLAASGVKRNNGIKDYGKLIPGHGGIMDRFDSVLFTAPIIYYLAILLIRFE